MRKDAKRKCAECDCGHVNPRRRLGGVCGHADGCPCVVTSSVDDDADLFELVDGVPRLRDRRKLCQLLCALRAAPTSDGPAAKPALCKGTSKAKTLQLAAIKGQGELIRTTLDLYREREQYLDARRAEPGRDAAGSGRPIASQPSPRSRRRHALRTSCRR